jgi:hypothetical protein
MTRTRLALLMLTLAACKDPEREELLSELDDYDYERDGLRVLFCSCPGELGYASEEECEADQIDMGPEEKACIADAFDGRESLGVDYYSCVVPLQREYQFCLADRLGSCEFNWFAPCKADYDTAVLETCPNLPSELDSALSQCLPGG